MKEKEIKTEHQHKDIMQTSEVQRPETEIQTKIMCSVTKIVYFGGEMQFRMIQQKWNI